jgi:hypothetical protein
MDGVHEELGCAPARDKHLYVGKEVYPIVYPCLCGPQLVYLQLQPCPLRRKERQTMATMDKYLKMLSNLSVCPLAYYYTCKLIIFMDVVVCLSMHVKNNPMYMDHTFDMPREDGNSFCTLGVWVLCDTGYYKRRQIICGFKRTSEPKRSRRGLLQSGVRPLGKM